MLSPVSQRWTSHLRFRCADSLDRLRKALFSLSLGLICSQAIAGDLEDAEKLFRTGKYDECVKAVEAGIENDGWNESWRQLKIKTELARGRDKEAIAALEEALIRFPASISLHLLGSQIYRQTGQAGDAALELETITKLFENSPRRYATPDGWVTIGRLFLLRGEDAQGAGPVL